MKGNVEKSYDVDKTKVFLQLAFELAEKICHKLTIEEVYQVILDEICEKLDWDYGELWLIDNKNERLYKSTISHVGSVDLKYYNIKSHDFNWGLNEGLPGRTWATKKSIWVPNIKNEPTFIRQDLAKECRLFTGVTLPIFAFEHVDSVLFFFSKKEKKFDSIFMDLLQNIAGNIGLLIVKNQLEKEVNLAQLDLIKLLDLNFKTLTKILEYRDPYTIQHQNSVADVAVELAKRMNLNESTINDIYLASKLHDIGKISVPMEILNKPFKLSKEEFALIKVHPQTSFDIIRDFPCNSNVKRMVLEHHERNNGLGYPNGLKSEEILPESKILIVADVLSAMIEDRPYRRGLTVQAVIEELENGKNIKYDEKVVDIAIELLHDKELLKTLEL